MTQNELDNLYNLGLFRDSDDDAKGYLDHDHPFVVSELLKAPEHEVYDRALSFLRLTGLIKFFDKRHILGKIFNKK